VRSLINEIQGDDPSFDPVALACHASGVDRRTFGRALSRVVYDGYYGPVSPSDWQECHEDGYPFEVDVSRVSDALAILGRVSDAIDDYRETFFGEDDDGDEIQWQETAADAADIRREVFSAVFEIYGRLPW